jgi:hypothetical protein
MVSDSAVEPSENGDHGLPEVTPPSARHIVQLFLVPGILVAVFVLAYAGWKTVTRSWYTPDALLKRLDNPDADVRWRAAHDMAQVLLRDSALASDASFALDVAERLRLAFDAQPTSVPPKLGAASSDERSAEILGPDEAEKEYIEYLSACVGNFTVPAGVPLLERVATIARGPSSDTMLAVRRRAIWALANAGDGLKRFDALDPLQKSRILEVLSDESGSSERGRWAKEARSILAGRLEGKPTAPGVAETL